MELIKPVKENEIAKSNFKYRYVDCLVLTQDGKILLQQRGEDWQNFPGYLSAFGGRIEAHESPEEAIVRELKEELGALVEPADLIFIGALTEAITNHSELIYSYFWQDRKGTITGCYEGEARIYEVTTSLLQHPKVMDNVRWLLEDCQARQLFKLAEY